MGKNITPKGIKNIYFYLIIFITKRKHKFTASAQQGTTEKWSRLLDSEISTVLKFKK